MRRPPISTRTDTLFPYTTLFRSPLPLLRPSVAALDELARNYGTSIVLCTATQPALAAPEFAGRSEEHTSELQSLMRISYAVFCLKKKTLKHTEQSTKHLIDYTHHTTY